MRLNWHSYVRQRGRRLTIKGFMKRISRFLCLMLLLLTTINCSCSTTQQGYPPEIFTRINEDKIEYYDQNVENMLNSTAILVVPFEGEYAHVCSGVFLENGLILTARHCVKAVEPIFATIDDQLHLSPPWLHAVGDRMQFINHETYMKMDGKDIKIDDPDNKPFEAVVVDIDLKNDLMLLFTKDSFTHSEAKITQNPSLWIGQKTWIVGHPGHMKYVFLSGMISGYQDMDDEDEVEKDLIVQAPIYMGISGGGMFSENGDLLGICSKYAVNVPTIGFFVDHKAIWNFVSQHLVGSKLPVTSQSQDL